MGLSMSNFEKAKDAILNVIRHGGTAWVELGDLSNGKKLCFVVGWQDGYEDNGHGFAKHEDGTLYTLACKLAYNCDALQCDYDMDWVMPVEKSSGDVVDTESMVMLDWWVEWEYWERLAKQIIEDFKKGKLR